jgi:hypothetical protein
VGTSRLIYHPLLIDANLLMHSIGDGEVHFETSVEHEWTLALELDMLAGQSLACLIHNAHFEIQA